MLLETSQVYRHNKNQSIYILIVCILIKFISQCKSCGPRLLDTNMKGVTYYKVDVTHDN